tara:strand:- start:155 stop:379 length:225 start_codon:yes stop_codon:yes gene_type:complete
MMVVTKSPIGSSQSGVIYTQMANAVLGTLMGGTRSGAIGAIWDAGSSMALSSPIDVNLKYAWYYISSDMLQEVP